MLRLALFGSLLVAPAAAPAASLVIGSGLARECYEAAERERANAATVETCSRSLAEEALGFDDQAATYVNRGILRARLGDRTGAIGDYDRAIGMRPDAGDAYLNKGGVLLLEGKFAAARALFDAALARATSRPELAHFGRAVAAESVGDLGRAYADYRRAAELAPRWDCPRQELARFSVRKRG